MEKVCRWVDDTISYIRGESNEYGLSKLDGYHDNIKLTCEIETYGELPFLGVLLIPKDYKVETTVYQKSTNNGIYFHW